MITNFFKFAILFFIFSPAVLGSISDVNDPIIDVDKHLFQNSHKTFKSFSAEHNLERAIHDAQKGKWADAGINMHWAMEHIRKAEEKWLKAAVALVRFEGDDRMLVDKLKSQLAAIRQLDGEIRTEAKRIFANRKAWDKREYEGEAEKSRALLSAMESKFQPKDRLNISPPARMASISTASAPAFFPTTASASLRRQGEFRPQMNYRPESLTLQKAAKPNAPTSASFSPTQAGPAADSESQIKFRTELPKPPFKGASEVAALITNKSVPSEEQKKDDPNASKLIPNDPKAQGRETDLSNIISKLESLKKTLKTQPIIPPAIKPTGTSSAPSTGSSGAKDPPALSQSAPEKDPARGSQFTKEAPRVTESSSTDGPPSKMAYAQHMPGAFVAGSSDTRSESAKVEPASEVAALSVPPPASQPECTGSSCRIPQQSPGMRLNPKPAATTSSPADDFPAKASATQTAPAPLETPFMQNVATQEEFDQAIKDAKAQGKPLVVYGWGTINGKKCPFCKKAEDVLWSNPEVQDWLKEHAITIKVDITSKYGNELLGRKYRIQTAPTVLMFNGDDAIAFAPLLNSDKFIGQASVASGALYMPVDGIIAGLNSFKEPKTFQGKGAEQIEAEMNDLIAGLAFKYQSLVRAGKFDDAKKLAAAIDSAMDDEQFKKMLPKNYERPIIYNKLAWAAFQSGRAGDYDGAKALALKACELSGYKNPSQLDTLNQILIQRKDVPALEQVARKLLEQKNGIELAKLIVKLKSRDTLTFENLVDALDKDGSSEKINYLIKEALGRISPGGQGSNPSATQPADCPETPRASGVSPQN